MWMEMFNSLPLSCLVGTELGLGWLLCRETSSLGAAYNNTALIWPCWGGGEASKSFTKGLASLGQFRDKETERRHDLP